MKRLMIGAGVVGAIGIAAYVLLTSLFPPLCDSKLLWEKISPNNMFVMTAFVLDCGATTDYTVALSIRYAKDPFDSGDHEDVVLTMDKADHLGAKWVGDSQIEVLLPGRKRIFKQLNQWNTVKLNYLDE